MTHQEGLTAAPLPMPPDQVVLMDALFPSGALVCPLCCRSAGQIDTEPLAGEELATG